MTKQVLWTQTILLAFIKLALLDLDELRIIRTRVINKWSIKKQAILFGMSLATVCRIVLRLKKKYDAASKNNPLLPQRQLCVRKLYNKLKLI